MRLALLSRRRLVKYLSQRQVQLSQVESAAAVIVELVKENVGRPHLRADPQAVDEALTKFDLAHPALALLVPELDEILGLELALENGEPHACRHGAIKCNQVQSSAIKCSHACRHGTPQCTVKQSAVSRATAGGKEA